MHLDIFFNLCSKKKIRNYILTFFYFISSFNSTVLWDLVGLD